MRNINLSKLLLPLMAIAAGFVIYQYTRPLPAIEATNQIITVPKTEAVALPWPSAGQAAIGASNYGLLAEYNTTAPVPIASISKVIAALAVLEQKPLAIGQQGPLLTLDGQDLDYYNYYYSNDGSAAKVTAGEQISEYQALQGMMLPSANNLADSLTRWAFGSSTAYTAYANKMVKNMGLTGTTVGSASGFADDTTSSASDLVKLGLAAMKLPVLADVVSQQTANIPVAGDVKNVNWLLGSEGVVGIKTGNTQKAGGCYLFAANRQINGKTVTVVGAILGVPQLNDAISAAKPLLQASSTAFSPVTVIHKNQILGTYNTPWGTSTKAVAANDVPLLAWKGADIQVVNKLNALQVSSPAGTQAGKAGVRSGDLSVSSTSILNGLLPGPSWRWRIFR